jgi:hypothetical protein
MVKPDLVGLKDFSAAEAPPAPESHWAKVWPMLAPSFQDFCFISAFTVHSPPDVDNEQINQGQ